MDDESNHMLPGRGGARVARNQPLLACMALVISTPHPHAVGDPGHPEDGWEQQWVAVACGSRAHIDAGRHAEATVPRIDHQKGKCLFGLVYWRFNMALVRSAFGQAPWVGLGAV